MAPTIEKVVENCEFAEGPYWDEETQNLYFIDIVTRAIHRYVPATKRHTKAVLDTNSVAIIIPVKGERDKFLVALERELAIVTWDGESDKVSDIKKIFKLDKTEVGVRLNDGKCDPSGRLWIGTMVRLEKGKPFERVEIGKFYSFQGNTLRTFLTKIGISNGLAFNVGQKKFYYIDTFTGTVDEFDFDLENGIIVNRKAIFTVKNHGLPGAPDGMAIDADGNLWVALQDRVIKIDPRKPETLLDVVILPAKYVTSVAFGGKNLDELYVTSSKPWTGGAPSPDDGAIFKITGLNAKGLPGVRFAL